MLKLTEILRQIKQIEKCLKLLPVLLGVVTLVACKEEIKNPGEASDDGTATVIFIIPDENLHFATRAADDRVEADNDEGYFSNIYLLYTKVSDENGTHVDEFYEPVLLNGKELGGSDNKYRYYSKTFTPGTYRFYVVVNFNNYLGEGNTVVNTITSEEKAVSLIRNFNTTERINTRQLPMACLNTEFLKNGQKVSGGLVTISNSGNTELVAPLTFLCSKVRYTILFDASTDGFSKEFGDKRINFLDNPYVINSGNKTPVLNEEDYTSKIKNPGFDKNINNGLYNSVDDWEIQVKDNDNQSNRTFFSEYKISEFYYCNFDFYQTLNNMPAGLYRLEVQGFYRAGDIGPASSSHNNGTERLLPKLYINNSGKSLMSLYDVNYGNVYTQKYPNDRRSANEAFNNDNTYVGNSVTYLLPEEGELRIGIKKEDWIEGDWTCFDNFKLYYTPIEEETASVPISLGKYNWPANPEQYPTSANDRLRAVEGDEWENSAQRAWQGVAYLPENLTTDIAKKTTLHFPYNYDTDGTIREKSLVLFDASSNTTGYTGGLERGMMYDIVIKVKKPDPLNEELILEVSVKPWNYNPSEVVW